MYTKKECSEMPEMFKEANKKLFKVLDFNSYPRPENYVYCYKCEFSGCYKNTSNMCCLKGGFDSRSFSSCDKGKEQKDKYL